MIASPAPTSGWYEPRPPTYTTPSGMESARGVPLRSTANPNPARAKRTPHGPLRDDRAAQPAHSAQLSGDGRAPPILGLGSKGAERKQSEQGTHHRAGRWSPTIRTLCAIRLEPSLQRLERVSAV